MDKTGRTDLLLALILIHEMKGAPMRDKILQLNLAGFSNIEIADVLQTTSANVSQSLYETRRATSRRTKKMPTRKRTKY